MSCKGNCISCDTISADKPELVPTNEILLRRVEELEKELKQTQEDCDYYYEQTNNYREKSIQFETAFKLVMNEILIK